MSFIDEWSADVLTRASRVLTRPVEVEGERKAHLGPRLEVARVRLLVEPAEAFEVSIEAPGLDAILGGASFARAAVLGFLDVVLLAEPQPLRKIRVRVLEVRIDPVSSSAMAFRRAGRVAGKRLLESLGTQ